MEVVKDSIANGDNVYLREFGTFGIKERAKNARNISKDTTLIVPAHKAPSFKPSYAFKEKPKI